MAHSTEDFLSRAETHFRDRGYLRTAGRLKILRKIKSAKDVNASSLIAPIIDDALASFTFRSMQNGVRNARPVLEETVSTSMMVQSSILIPQISDRLEEIAEAYMAAPIGSDRLDHLWAVYDPVKDDASAAFGAIPLLVNTYHEVWEPVANLLARFGAGQEVIERMFSVGSAVEKGGVRSDFGYVYDRCVTMKNVDVAGNKLIAGDVSVPVAEFVLWPRVMEMTVSILMDILVCVAARGFVLSRS